jgi:hypothetical protein
VLRLRFCDFGLSDCVEVGHHGLNGPCGHCGRGRRVVDVDDARRLHFKVRAFWQIGVAAVDVIDSSSALEK